MEKRGTGSISRVAEGKVGALLVSAAKEVGSKLPRNADIFVSTALSRISHAASTVSALRRGSSGALVVLESGPKSFSTLGSYDPAVN